MSNILLKNILDELRAIRRHLEHQENRMKEVRVAPGSVRMVTAKDFIPWANEGKGSP